MKTTLSVIAIIVCLFTFSMVASTCNQTQEHVTDNAFNSYEEFQEIFNTCSKLNTDLCNMRSINEKDPMFNQFSKAQRVNSIKTNLNHWVEEYNAKSKMWNRALWKSKSLPYALSVDDFKCYEDK